MADARWIVLAAAVLLVLAGVGPLLRRASAVIAAETRARRLLDAVWTALPIAFLAVLLALTGAA